MIILDSLYLGRLLSESSEMDSRGFFQMLPKSPLLFLASQFLWKPTLVRRCIDRGRDPASNEKMKVVRYRMWLYGVLLSNRKTKDYK